MLAPILPEFLATYLLYLSQRQSASAPQVQHATELH
jgi:hypothetical protein